MSRFARGGGDPSFDALVAEPEAGLVQQVVGPVEVVEQHLVRRAAARAARRSEKSTRPLTARSSLT